MNCRLLKFKLQGAVHPSTAQHFNPSTLQPCNTSTPQQLVVFITLGCRGLVTFRPVDNIRACTASPAQHITCSTLHPLSSPASDQPHAMLSTSYASRGPFMLILITIAQPHPLLSTSYASHDPSCYVAIDKPHTIPSFNIEN